MNVENCWNDDRQGHSRLFGANLLQHYCAYDDAEVSENSTRHHVKTWCQHLIFLGNILEELD